MRCSQSVLSWLLLVIICASCGSRGKGYHEAQSMAEAKILAAEKGTLIVIDFWRHG